MSERDPMRDAVAGVIARASDPLLAPVAADMILRAIGEAFADGDVYGALDRLEAEATRLLGAVRPAVNRRDRRAGIRAENKAAFGRYSG